MSAVDLGPGSAFHAADPLLHNTLLRQGIATAEALDTLCAARMSWPYPGRRPAGLDSVTGWRALLILPSTGPRRVQALVTWLRDQGAELSWSADWDRADPASRARYAAQRLTAVAAAASHGQPDPSGCPG